MIGRSKMIQSLIFITLFFFNCSFTLSEKFNVVKYKKDETSDWTQAFLDAWKLACNSSSTRVTIYAPKGKYLMGHPVVFDGSGCTKKDKILFLFRGSTLVGPSNYNDLQGEDHIWLQFYKVDRLIIRGGTIYAHGEKLWDCKKSHNKCPQGVTSLGIYNSHDTSIQGLTSINSQMFHIVVYGSDNITLDGIRISAPEDSPNTDGIHLQQSSNVVIKNCIIKTGDDCISIGESTQNLSISNIYCGPGHGISIGSLGRSPNEGNVQDVTVKNITFHGADNGVRIKTWSLECNAIVKNIIFQDILTKNTDNPVIINQNYCPAEPCPQEGVHGVKISNVTFERIYGISSTETAVKLDCNNCENINLNGIQLSHVGEPATAYCTNVQQLTLNNVDPRPEC